MITIPLLDFQLESQQFSDVGYARSSGLHLSTIIADLNEVRGGSKYPETDDATRQAYFAIGFAWEQMLTSVFLDTTLKARRGALIRPGEFHLDGIAMSPDAVDLDAYVLEEYKATYQSCIHDIEDKRFWPWFVQMKAYCKALGTRTARLRVWFIVGDWRGSGPQAKAWEFCFTEREIEENWSMVVSHARYRGWL